MHRLIPTFILEKYRAGEFQGQFNAVGMFLDVSGFSNMTDSLMQHGAHGAEVLGTIMRNVFDPLLMTIFEQGGAIIGLAGDGLMALYPCDHDEDHALLHALASAWNMQRQLHAQPERETVYGSFPISAKIGLSMGKVEWGILQSRDGEQATYYFRGPAVDEASDAEHHARAGEIVMTQALCDCFDGLVTQPRYEFCLLENITITLPPAQRHQLPPIDHATARRFIPNALLDDGLHSEFRQAVNLFVHFPDLSDADLPELVYALFDLQKRYGGLFTRLDFGDKGGNLLLFWGAPVAHQNDIGRALNFITDLQAQLDFPLQAGVTYHISRAGYMGGELHEDYTCYGWGINLASRFMMSAPPGQVWVDERVAQRVRRRFAFEYLSEQRFKGFAQKQKVYLLQGRKPQLEILFEGELVGRQAELAQLDDFIAPLQTGQEAGTLMVWGEPGVGKSRLLYEWIRSPHFARQQVTWAVCQSDQVLQQSFNPFRYWLRQYFGLGETLLVEPVETRPVKTPRIEPVETGSAEIGSRQARPTETPLVEQRTEFAVETELAETKHLETKRSRFDERLDALIATIHNPTLAAELDRLRSILAALVDLRWPDSLYELLDAQGRYDSTLLAITRLIEAESLRHPLVLVLEDAHFLDADSLAFLPRLLRALRATPTPCPLALLLTARHQDAALHLDSSLTARALELQHLPPDDLITLAANLLEGPIAPDLAEMLETRAEGNPFFAEQLLHYLRDQNLLEWSAQGWRVLTAWNPAMLPTDISAVIVARLDQLAREVKAVIQTAAVLGREFEVLVLANMLHDNDHLSSELDEAERAAIWSPMSEIRYLFKHALVRDTAYAMQMQTRRHELHALAVEALERLYAKNLPAQIENLAYHSEAAGLDEKARRYLEQAGDAARDTYQNARAEDYYTRALVLTPEEDVESRFRQLVARQKVLIFQGKHETQQDNLRELKQVAEIAKDNEKLFMSKYWNAVYLLATEETTRSIAEGCEALQLAQQMGIPHLMVMAGHILAEAHLHNGSYDQAISHCEESLQIIRQNNIPDTEQASLLNLYGLILIEKKSPSNALTYFEQSLVLYQQANHLRGCAMALNNQGLVASNQGDYSTAQKYYEKSLQFARQLGHRHGECLVLGNLAWLSSMLGDYQTANRFAQSNLQIARETGRRDQEILGLINLSNILVHLEVIIEAICSVENALQLAHQLNNRNLEAWALTYLGHALLANHQLSKAHSAYQRAIVIRNELQQPVLACEPWAGVLQIAIEQHERHMLQLGLSNILTYLDGNNGLDGTDEPLRVYQTSYRALVVLDDPRANQILKTAHQLLKQRAANISDEAARQRFLEEIPWNREIQSFSNAQPFWAG
jgi:predicted ATPase/class 3 adenylate cyclase